MKPIQSPDASPLPPPSSPNVANSQFKAASPKSPDDVKQQQMQQQQMEQQQMEQHQVTIQST